MPAPFQLLASHPALDFVNTLDDRFLMSGPKELLPEYGDLLAFSEQSGFLNARQTGALRKHSGSARADKTLTRAHEMREALASAFYEIVAKGRPFAETLTRIEKYSLEAQGHRRLVWTRAGAGDAAHHRAVWMWDPIKSDVELPLWAITQSAADLLTSAAIAHVNECRSPTCRWLFLDTSKNHSRRWCDMSICGNRMKARRFQARQ